MNFSVAVIVKNEAKTLPRLVASLREFQKRGGEILAYDTGSTDGTPDLARSLGCKTVEAGTKHIFTIDAETAKAVNDMFIVEGEAPVMKKGDKMFNFAEARNAAAVCCSNDFIAMPDADEVYTTLDLDKICGMIGAGCEQLEYNFCFSHDNFGNPLVKFTHSKFYDRRKLKWIGYVHEVLSGVAKRMFVGEDVCYLEHYQNPSSNRSIYLTGLALAAYKGTGSAESPDRAMHYFARELFWSGRPKSAIKLFEKHIAMNCWLQERAQSMIYMGGCYEALGDTDKQVECYLKAFTMDSSRREPLLKLCSLYRAKDDFQKVAAYAEASLSIPWNSYYHNDMRDYRDAPHSFLYWAYWWLGDKLKSKYHFEKCLEYAPNDTKYHWDARITEPWLVDLPEGWFNIVDIREYRRLIAMLPDGAGIAELGSWKGRSLCSVSELIKQKNIAVVAVDTFKGTENEGDAHKEAKEIDLQEVFEDNLDKYGVAESVTAMAMTTDAATKFINAESLDMVFVDADHSYEAVKRDIQNWLPKIKKGGFIAGHDYIWPGTKKAVDECLPGVHVANNVWSLKVE